MNDILLADFGIRQLLARYADAVWRQDLAAFVDCFAAEGAWHIAGASAHGHDAIGARIATLLAPAARVRLIAGDPLLQVEGGTAIGRVPITELVKRADGGALMNLGTYHDRYVACGEWRWRFAARRFVVHYRGPPDLSAALTGEPECGPFPAMPDADAAG